MIGPRILIIDLVNRDSFRSRHVLVIHPRLLMSMSRVAAESSTTWRCMILIWPVSWLVQIPSKSLQLDLVTLTNPSKTFLDQRLLIPPAALWGILVEWMRWWMSVVRVPMDTTSVRRFWARQEWLRLTMCTPTLPRYTEKVSWSVLSILSSSIHISFCCCLINQTVGCRLHWKCRHAVWLFPFAILWGLCYWDRGFL